MAVSAAILTRVPAAFLPLKPSLNSNRTNRKNRTKSEEKPPKQAVFLRKVVRVTGFEPAASCSQIDTESFYALFSFVLCAFRSIPFAFRHSLKVLSPYTPHHSVAETVVKTPRTFADTMHRQKRQGSIFDIPAYPRCSSETGSYRPLFLDMTQILRDIKSLAATNGCSQPLKGCPPFFIVPHYLVTQC